MSAATLRERVGERRRRARLLPVGEPATSRRWTPDQRRGSVLRAGAYALALVATVAGVLLAAAPSTSVALTATTYRIGDTTLRAGAAGSYDGNAALVIAPAGAGAERAAADTTVAGRPETGVCFLVAAEAQERCIFVIASTSVSAVDTWTSAGWSRRYDDGQQLTIPAAAMIPVPFAVGR